MHKIKHSYRGCDADEYFWEPAGCEQKERQSSPNRIERNAILWGYRQDLYHSFTLMKRSYYLSGIFNRV
jgi:hypothetical protein